MANQQNDASQDLIHFLGQFTGLMEKQLQGIRLTMLDTVDKVMQGVTQISQETESNRVAAEKVLEETYINPDVETQVLVDDLQKMIGNLFEEVQSRYQEGENLSELTTAEPEILLQNRMKRFDSKFMAEMNQLTTLDDNLKAVLFGMIGALSSEDVIAQRMDHVIMALKVLQTGLNYVLIDYVNRCNDGELKKVTSEIKNYTFRQYTSEDEKKEFLEFFPGSKVA